MSESANSVVQKMLVLASASPRRKQLLNQLGLEFSISVAAIDESRSKGETPDQYVVRLAQQKALAVLSNNSFPESTLILAADTSIVVADKIIGKPTSFTNAVENYRQLSGQVHHVLSAVCLMRVEHRSRYKCETRLSCTEVEFKHLSDDEINHYWRTCEPIDKAAGYAIQGLGAIFIKRINGSYSGVMGLPLYETSELLAIFGLDVLGTINRVARSRSSQ